MLAHTHTYMATFRIRNVVSGMGKKIKHQFVVVVHTQPPTVVNKMEAQLEYMPYTLQNTFGADLYAKSVLINKISASELSRKFTKSALLVGYACILSFDHRDLFASFKNYVCLLC